MVAGTACGILIGLARTADRLSSWSVEMLRPIPSVALIPLLPMQTTLGAAYLSYAVGFAPAVDIADWCASALFSFALLYFNLRFATSLRHPAITAALSVALLLALMFGYEKAGEDEFIPYPVEEPLLRAPFLKLRDGLSFDDYEQQWSELFAELREEK